LNLLLPQQELHNAHHQYVLRHHHPNVVHGHATASLATLSCGIPGIEGLVMIAVNSVEAIPDYWLILTFTGGERRRFDMRPYLNYPVFRRLENLGYFSQNTSPITLLITG
jgi:hypothetical protein